MRQIVPDGAPPAKGVRSTRVVLRPRWQCTHVQLRAQFPELMRSARCSILRLKELTMKDTLLT